jgi:GH35 family endo-1,4-beta-xylanase
LLYRYKNGIKRKFGGVLKKNQKGITFWGYHEERMWVMFKKNGLNKPSTGNFLTKRHELKI